MEKSASKDRFGAFCSRSRHRREKVRRCQLVQSINPSFQLDWLNCHWTKSRKLNIFMNKSTRVNFPTPSQTAEHMQVVLKIRFVANLTKKLGWKPEQESKRNRNESKTITIQRKIQYNSAWNKKQQITINFFDTVRSWKRGNGIG